jgi:hypothetical protein
VPDGPVPHYEVQPDPAHSGQFRVVNRSEKAPDGDGPLVHGSGMTKADAVKQWRLLEAGKHDPGWEPHPGAVSTLQNVPGPGKYPGTGYSQIPRPGSTRTRRHAGGG